ncbi:MAG: rod shape-determining protein MreC [Candidatus Omnitrophica bacterium]|nr:rod shape-determining protein MreC [Candidatus Omnitrophota bacterium]MDD5352751.1 rod shape-determining protein MreC [Candidatus Omnitrophota bacterium]MDD5550350.1 rod shape-determining protein MreC [Candidatus Omnitrophota bacterium]
MANKNKTILLFVVFVIVTFLLIKSPQTSSLPQKIALNLSRLPLKLVGLSLIPFESAVNFNRILGEATLLKKENQQLKLYLMQLQEAAAQNSRLRELLGFKQSSPFALVIARVISFDASNIRRSLVIDKGRNYKIRIGNPVITSDGMVGVVAEVGNSASRILLISDTDFSIAAKVKRSNAIGIISGSLEGVCKLKYLDLDDDIQRGDEIISSGENSRFPAGIPIGTVTDISKEQSGLTVFAVVKPKVRLSALEEVLVIINY